MNISPNQFDWQSWVNQSPKKSIHRHPVCPLGYDWLFISRNFPPTDTTSSPEKFFPLPLKNGGGWYVGIKCASFLVYELGKFVIFIWWNCTTKANEDSWLVLGNASLNTEYHTQTRCIPPSAWANSPYWWEWAAVTAQSEECNKSISGAEEHGMDGQ